MTNKKNSPASARSQFAIRNSQFESGIALVITLILLSVTLVMAVAFLAISRRERNAVTTATDTTTARYAADTALAAAQAQIAANILATTNPYSYDLLVSTNYINPAGITPNTATLDYISYYDLNGNLLGGDNLSQVVTNLYLLPRPPVFINTNSGSPLDFRFYLDLNRNGQYEASGLVPDVEYSNGILVTNAAVPETGDPEWIGVLEHPDQPHGPNNPFIARYCFAALPAGNSLDLNYIHNQVFNPSANLTNAIAANDGYFRNEGVGSWELNLAAFLADLNTNIWATNTAPYYYGQPQGFVNNGFAFYDAGSLLAWRLANNYNTLAVPPLYFYDILTNVADGYTHGYLMTSTFLPQVNPPANGANTPWAGSDNTNRFFALSSDLFDPAKSTAGFVNRLASTGNSPATYDRYTYYRMLDELGTDSGSDDTRMNLNYDNLDSAGNVVPGAETNGVAWTAETGGALRFFTNAADRMLRYYTANWSAGNNNYAYFTNTFGASTTNAFGVGNIPVYVNGQFVYTPAVNRLLQLAANMYDASTTNFYPSVFRPLFTRSGNNIFISGYELVSASNQSDLPLLSPLVDITDTRVGVVPVNVYGVPWIIGVKKGMPGFNQFYMLNTVQVSRKLQVSKPALNALNSIITNQMYTFSISNLMGCSLWNPYTNSYTNLSGITIFANDNVTMWLTNDGPGAVTPVGNTYLIASNYISIPAGANWPGTVWGGDPSVATLDPAINNNSFIIPFNVPFEFMTNSIYRYNGYVGNQPLPNGAAAGFDPNNLGWQTNGSPPANGFTPPLPQLTLLTTNRLQVFILDGNHVIDYVHFAGPESSRNLNEELADPDSINGKPAYNLWSTNGINGPGTTPWGVGHQIDVSGTKSLLPSNLKWVADPSAGAPVGAEADYFNAFFVQGHKYFDSQSVAHVNTNLSVQAPYTATRTIYDYETWQANDPLVHYLASDLNNASSGVTGLQRDTALPSINLRGFPITPTRIRYSPWGQTYPFSTETAGQYLTQIKDPLVWQPDSWDFPNYKYPTVGWLGRVHRGTPWQTVYLKASDVLAGVLTNAVTGVQGWAQWTGDQQAVNNIYYDAINSAPMQDAGLFSLFSASLNDNATHGTLSVNQTHLAAWSAVFSGLVALTNTAPSLSGYKPPMLTNMIISPAGVMDTTQPYTNWPALAQIVNGPAGINSLRANTNYFSQQVFTRVGDILRAPALTEQSPFLNWNDSKQQANDISDEVYEWLPQQMLGLLRANSTPRYVVYCYGQTLRPAPNGLVTSGGAYFDLCTNYQVTAESAARAVIRVEPRVTTVNGVTSTNYSTVIESFNPLPPN